MIRSTPDYLSHIIHPAILLGLVFVLATGCEDESKPEATYISEPKEIELGDGNGEAEASTLVEDETYTEEEKPVPRVQVPPDAQIIQLLEVNLDLDRNDEQVLAIKDTQKGAGAVRLMIADYDTVRDKYVVTWKGKTLATSRRSFNVSVVDATGDHNLEILCNGMTEDGRQTMDIFRRTSSPDQLGLYFETILSLEVMGTIELKEEKRSQSYQKGLRSGTAYPVVTTTKDESSERLGDIVKTTYAWRPVSSEYLQVTSEKIPGQEIEDNQLRDLLQGKKEDLKKFLDGPWLLSASANNPSNRYIVHFDSSDESVTLYSGSIQESYDWNNTYRFLADSLSISGENTIVPFMHIYISAHVRDLSTVRITMSDVNSHNGTRSTNSTWSGTYRKLGPSMQKSFLRTPQSTNAVEGMPSLTGIYKNDSGLSIYFDPPKFRLVEKGETIRGGFSTYSFGTDILELRVVDKNGVIEERRCYSFDFIEERREEEIVRRLILRPGEIERKGFRPTDSNPLVFHQREVIQDESEKNGEDSAATEESAGDSGKTESSNG